MLYEVITPMALMAKKHGYRSIILPVKSAAEAALVEGVEVYPVNNLSETVRFLEGQLAITRNNFV